MVMNDDKNLERFAWVVIVFSIFYFGGHFLIALAYGWDGELNSLSENTAIYGTGLELNTGTRSTVENSGLVIPGGEVQIIDSEGNTHDMEVITINPDTGGPVRMELYDAETHEYYEMDMNIR